MKEMDKEHKFMILLTAQRIQTWKNEVHMDTYVAQEHCVSR